MTLRNYLYQKNITKYHLFKISGVPKTTIIDICAGKSAIQKCSAKTIKQIAIALNCTMEEIMKLDEPKIFNPETGHPKNKGYLECGLPPYLQKSLENIKRSWKIEDSGEWDIH